MKDNPRLGIILMIATMIIFSIQDGLSRHLAESYNVITVVMIRYMFFMLFVMAYSARLSGGIIGVATSRQTSLQIARGILLVAQICLAVLSLARLGWSIFTLSSPAIR